jgi:GH43 family beta-xylosidase
VTFSGSGVDRTYCVGLLSADADADLLEADSWAKQGFPILTSAHVSGQDGPGHNSYFIEDDGKAYNVFHAIPSTSGSNRQRHTGIRIVHFAADGRPVLDMVTDREILPANRTVRATVTVTGAPVEPGEREMLAHYEFTDTGNAAVVVDSSGNGRHAALKGAGGTQAAGVLTLPGGNSGSGAGYAELPQGLFDGQDTLTVSAWVKNETGAGNYAVMFFGSASNPPAHYWLMNPANPSGRFKSVITNSLNASAPYSTEYGFSPSTAANGTDGPVTGSDWALYTTVIRPGAILAYHNGASVGSVAVTRTVSEFGNDLVAYIGKSSYPDKFFKGRVKDVRIYAEALTQQEIWDLYYAGADADEIEAALAKDAAALRLPDAVVADMELPAFGESGSRIAWNSSNDGVITSEGKVTRPVGASVTVTLTATLSIGGRTLERSFSVTALPEGDAGTLDLIAGNLDIGIQYVTGDIALPSEYAAESGTAGITWSSSPELIAGNGAVTRPSAGEGDAAVTLTARLTLGDAVRTKTFPVTVAEADAGALLTYVKEGGNKDEHARAVYAAISKDGAGYEVLNSGKPIRYTKLGSKFMAAPSVFRAPDGTFVLIAADGVGSDSVVLFDSADLTEFGGERIFKLNESGIKVSEPYGVYDNGLKAYRIRWKGGDGKYYETVTDLSRIFSVNAVDGIGKPEVSGNLPDGAVQASAIGLTAREYGKIALRYGRVYNTGVEGFADIEFDLSAVGGDVSPTAGALRALLPETATLVYSDGTTREMGVVWDESDVTAIEAAVQSGGGEVTVDGTVSRPTYADPFIKYRADPYVTRGSDGYYYFTASYPMWSKTDPEGYDRVVLRRSETLVGLKDAEEITIWDEKDSSTNHRYIWAPEIHEINGNWYVFVTASNTASTDGNFNIRCAVIACGGDGDPYKPQNWGYDAIYSTKHSSDTGPAFKEFSLDMT